MTVADSVNFAGLMAACGPFETKPHLAVGVSGGPDSLALLLLLADWVREADGKLTALTVDHALRANSRTEAEQVADWAAQAGVDHHILTWVGAKPQSGIQAAARKARYDLLTAWCRKADILHLAVAHQQDDQRETVAMRRARNGTSAGMAGMSLIAARQGVRLIRPLLPVSGEYLKTYLRTRGQIWLDDPSNRLTRFERIRWRQGLEGALPLPADIRAWGDARLIEEEAVADLLTRSVTLHDAGFALIDLSVWQRTNAGILPQALGQLVAMTGGQDYLPARAALSRMINALLSGAPQQSLGGSLIGSWRGHGLICREAAAVTETIAVTGEAAFSWDRRFHVNVTQAGIPVWLGPLGETGVTVIGQKRLFRLKDWDIPAPARASLPAFRDATGRLIAVPHLGFDPYEQASNIHFRFRPHYSATPSGFTVAYG